MSWTTEGMVLRRGTPEILPLALDRHEELVQVPCFSPLGEEIFDISEAQTESVVEPDGVAGDLGRESVSGVARCIGFHRCSLPVSAST